MRCAFPPYGFGGVLHHSAAAAGAAAFGFRVIWVNRTGAPQENLPASPERQIKTLAELPPLLGIA